MQRVLIVVQFILLVMLFFNPDRNFSPLTLRQTEVLELFALGLINKEIAERLYISYETVRTHRKKIMKFLEVKNITAACSLAVRMGWI